MSGRKSFVYRVYGYFIFRGGGFKACQEDSNPEGKQVYGVFPDSTRNSTRRFSVRPVGVLLGAMG